MCIAAAHLLHLGQNVLGQIKNCPGYDRNVTRPLASTWMTYDCEGFLPEKDPIRANDLLLPLIPPTQRFPREIIL